MEVMQKKQEKDVIHVTGVVPQHGIRNNLKGLEKCKNDGFPG